MKSCTLHHKSLLFALLFLGTLMGCSKKVDINVPQQKPRLVLHGEGSDKRPLTLSITRSRNITESPGINEFDFFGVTGAIAEVYKDGALFDVLVENKQTKFFEGTKPLPIGHEYRVQVSAPGYETVTSTIQHKQPTNNSFNVVITPVNSAPGGNETSFEIAIEYTDPPGENRYEFLVELNKYKMGVYSEDVDLANAGSVDLFSSRTFYNIGEIFLSDATYNGRTKKLYLYLPGYYRPQSGSVTFDITMKQLSVSDYDFKRAWRMSVKAQDNPFAEPVIMPSNVVNGYGNVGLHTASTRQVIMRF